jgi:hypothetical protein
MVNVPFPPILPSHAGLELRLYMIPKETNRAAYVLVVFRPPGPLVHEIRHQVTKWGERFGPHTHRIPSSLM